MAIRSRLYLLDTFRGLASLSVVVWHYQHFFSPEAGVISPSFVPDQQPFYHVLRLFYVYGHEAVPVFFTLSGFVMFATYYQRISTREVSAWRFAALRFSRLYPLHLATLLFVVVVQQLSYAVDGKYIIFALNDGWHFALQLLFASHWGLQSGYSFNGPIWSVSVEIVLYAMFFVLTIVLGQRVQNPLIAVLAMFCAAVGLSHIPVAQALAHPAACFFLGGIAHAIWAAANSRRHQVVLAGTTAAVFASALAAHATVLPQAYLLHFIVFPAAIIFLAAVQCLLPTAGRGTRVLGDITYATYLIHSPIQISIMLMAKSTGYGVDFQTPAVFLLYFATVILLSIPIHHYFELPMQHWCRRKLLSSAPATVSPSDDRQPCPAVRAPPRRLTTAQNR